MPPKLFLSDLLLLNRLAVMRDFVVSIFFVERTIALGLRNIEKTLKLTKVGLKWFFEKVTEFASEDDAFDEACKLIPWLKKNV